MADGIDTIKVAQVLAGALIGGAENFYTRLVCALAEVEQLQQCAFTRENAWREGQFEAADVPVSRHRFGGAMDLLGHYQYHEVLQKWQPDIVLTYMNRATKLTPPGDYKLVARLGHYYDLKYYKHCDYWVGITKGICDYLVREGLPAKKIFHIPNFVNEAPVEALPKDSFNTPADRPLLLAAGRLHTHKGFDVLLKALPTIPDATLWLAGDGPEAASLKSLAEEVGVTGRVRFLGWRDDVNALMKTADLFVCPSRHEGLGSIVPESWLSKCPIVAARSQGPGELITHGETGLLVEIEAIQELSDSINLVLSDSALATSLIQKASTEYQQKYNKSIIVSCYYDMFKDLCRK